MTCNQAEFLAREFESHRHRLLGLAWMQAGRLRAVFVSTISGDTISAIDLVADPGGLGSTAVSLLDWPRDRAISQSPSCA